MATEVEEAYPLENGLPANQVTPQPVKEFYQKNRQYPAKVIVSPKHRVKWEEYFIPTAIQQAPSIKPLEGDIDAPMAQGYHIPIEYDVRIGEKTLICRGMQPLKDSVSQ